MGLRGEIFSTKINAGSRTYFFNIKENRHGDLFLNLVESKYQEEGGSFERHSVLVFQEDMEEFMTGMNEVVRYLKDHPKVSSRSSGGAVRRDPEAR